MTQRASVLFKTGWISLAIIGVAILVFGLIATMVPTSSDPPYLRAIGVASIGMGLFGLLITTIAYRRRERWAWFALWYYPLFWTAHLVGRLPPGREHVHQIVFIVRAHDLRKGGLMGNKDGLNFGEFTFQALR
jgi:hypothetical protein